MSALAAELSSAATKLGTGHNYNPIEGAQVRLLRAFSDAVRRADSWSADVEMGTRTAMLSCKMPGLLEALSLARIINDS